MNPTIERDSLSAAGRAAHDIGAAAMLGGNLFARVGMHPALRDVSNASERGRVVNNAWRRYGTVNGISLAAVLAGWAGARIDEASPGMLSPTERRLAIAKDVAVASVAITGVASGLAGMSFAAEEEGGAVPLTDGGHASAETPPRAARMKRALNGLGALNLAASFALVGVNAALAQAGHRRPPVRRLLRRSY